MSEAVRHEAAEVIRRIVATLPMPASMASYLRGHANGLESRSEPAGKR